MKKLMSAVLTTMVISLLFSGVLFARGQKDVSKEKPTLTVWMKKQFVDDQNQSFEARVKEFAEMKDIEVILELIAYEDFFPKWTASIQSKVMPDLCYFGYQEVGQFYQQGLLEDVTDKLAAIQKNNGPIFEGSIAAITFDGRSYAFPIWGEGTAMYYRKDLLSAAGYSEPPGTWADFKEIATAVTDPSNGIYGAGLGYGTGNSDAEFLTRSIMFAFGGSLFDSNGNLMINTPENLEAINYIVSLFEDGLTPSSAIGWNDGGNNASYLSGQAAMVFNTGSIAKALQDSPELKANTGITLLPSGPAGQFTVGISNNMGIFKDARNKELAIELMEYLYEPDWYRTWIGAGAPLGLPVYKEMAKDEIWKEPFFRPFMDSMGVFRFLGYKGDYTPNAGKVYNMRLVNTMFESIIAANISIDEATKEFKENAMNLME